jgi:serine/threonine-protein kinase
LDRSDPEAAAACAPRVRNGGGLLWQKDQSGLYQLPSVDDQGLHWDSHWPVMGISFDDARTYCAWLAQRMGQPIRLPTEHEWEKAGRSADGRAYPWGDYFEPTYCKMALSRDSAPTPEKVGQFSADRSPYGIYDMAGLVSEYCDSQYSGAEDQRVGRGGNYLSTGSAQCRLSDRHAVQRDTPSLHHGFRLVRDVEGGAELDRQRIFSTR